MIYVVRNFKIRSGWRAVDFHSVQVACTMLPRHRIFSSSLLGQAVGKLSLEDERPSSSLAHAARRFASSSRLPLISSIYFTRVVLEAQKVFVLLSLPAKSCRRKKKTKEIKMQRKKTSRKRATSIKEHKEFAQRRWKAADCAHGEPSSHSCSSSAPFLHSW